MSQDPGSLGKVAVLLGGTSAEREVSLMSGQGVLDALRSVGVDAMPFDPAQGDLRELKDLGVQRVFICLHGRHGEDGVMQAALELMGLPYTGSGVLASALAMDKVMTKRVWVADGLPTPKHVLLPRGDLDEATERRCIEALGLPMIVKPAKEGSSIGVTKVSEAAQWRAAVDLARRHDPDSLCETFIDGPELTCPVITLNGKTTALPVIRIAAPGGDYDYEHKYFTDDVQYHCPSGLPPEMEERIQALTVQAFDSLGCRGWGRADWMLRASDDTPFLLEMNTSPGMTSHSLVPMSAKAAGWSYAELCVHLLSMASLDSQAT